MATIPLRLGGLEPLVTTETVAQLGRIMRLGNWAGDICYW